MASSAGQGGERTRRGSACRPLRPLPTFLRPDQGGEPGHASRRYIHKVGAVVDRVAPLSPSQTELGPEERRHNEDLYSDTMAALFPPGCMADKQFRDKDKDSAIKSWILKLSEATIIKLYFFFLFHSP